MDDMTKIYTSNFHQDDLEPLAFAVLKFHQNKPGSLSAAVSSSEV
jgi:hypothetical protein